MSLLAVACKPMRLSWGSLVVDLDGRTVRTAGRDVVTSRAEFDLIALLLRYRNVPLSKDFILSSLFGPEHGRDARQVDAFVARLRQSMQSAGIEDIISAMPGRGYAVIDPAHDGMSPVCRQPRLDHSLLAS